VRDGNRDAVIDFIPTSKRLPAAIESRAPEPHLHTSFEFFVFTNQP